MKNKILFLFIVAILVVSAIVLTACNKDKGDPEIKANDLSVEFDGLPHGIFATLSIAGGLSYEYVGIDNSYSSALEPTQPGKYKVTIKYTPDNMSKWKGVEKEVILDIVLPYTISADGTEISAYTGNSKDIVIPNEYKGKRILSIGSGTFDGKGVETVKFPQERFDVSPIAFGECDTLVRFYINENTKLLDGSYPNGLNIEYFGNPTTVSNSQFGTITGINEIKMPQSILTIESSGLLHVEAYSLLLPSHLVLLDVNLSSAIKKISVYNGGKSNDAIPNDFFNGCLFIEHIDVAQGFQSFGNRIFQGCTALNELVIHSAIQFVGEDIFKDCGIKKLKYNLTFSMQNVDVPQSLKEISISSEISEIPSFAFYGCEYVEKINIPNAVETIGNYSFWGCKALSEINIPNQLKNVGSYAFAKCFGLTSIDLPNSVMEIFDGAFSENTGLESITLPIGLKIINPYTFNGCSKIQSITIPVGVEEIGDFAFSQCEALETIVIPANVKTIGSSAFEFCTGIEELVLPESVIALGGHVFLRCDRLITLTILSATIPSMDGNVFFDLTDGVTVFVPSSLLSVYRVNFLDTNFEGIS
jgi:hypothetical protein